MLYYFLQTVLLSAIAALIYALWWRKNAAPRSCRIYLLSSLVLPFILPLIHLPSIKKLTDSTAYYTQMLPQIKIGAQDHHAQIFSTPGGLMVILYFSIAAIICLFHLWSRWKLLNILKHSPAVLLDGYYLHCNTGIGPGTTGRHIFLPGDNKEELIRAHEAAHIRLKHRYDLLVMMLIQSLGWANPFVWILAKQLKLAHEFEADEVVMKTAGTSYTEKLLQVAFQTNTPLLAHSFSHHPIKTRIMKIASKRWSAPNTLFACSLTLLLGAASLVLVQSCNKRTDDKTNATNAKVKEDTVIITRDGYRRVVHVAHTTEISKDSLRLFTQDIEKQILEHVMKSDSSRLSLKVRKLSDNEAYERMVPNGAEKQVDEAPEYPGNMQEFLMNNLNYPPDAKKAGHQGKAYIQFVVADNGALLLPRIAKSSGYTELDNEAIRVVQGLQGWKPGIKAGKAVATYFTLPIVFQLD